jgi:hypothetical protein
MCIHILVRCRLPSDVVRLGVRVRQAVGLARSRQAADVNPLVVVKCEQRSFTSQCILSVSASAPPPSTA